MIADNPPANARASKPETEVLAQLKKKSHEELLFLVEQLLERKPDIKPLLELLLELPIPHLSQEGKTSGRGNSRTLNLSNVRSQVASAFAHAGGGWNAPIKVADELGKLCEIGDSFAEAGEWANALAMYATIASSAIASYEEIQDEGQVSWVISECAANLASYLDIQSDLSEEEKLDVSQRKELLTTLFEIWKFGYEYGGIETDIPGLIVDLVTESERKLVASWLKQEIASGQGSEWRNQSVTSFLVKLQ